MNLDNHKIEDRILLRKAACQGCSDSLAEVYVTHRSSIFGYLKNKAPDSDMAEDVLQEVFKQILEGKCGYDGSSEPRNYLIGVARTLLKKELSREKAARSMSLPNDLANRFNDNNCQNPIDRLEEVELCQDLKIAISKLPAESRKAVESVYMVEKTSAEAAEELGCSYNTLRKRIKYALDDLRKRLSFLCP